MTIDLTEFIIRILSPQGRTSGTGFVVSPDGLIATCSHVVQSEGSQRRGDPRPEYVEVIFHATGECRRAKVEPEWWKPYDAEDVAILRVEGDLPAEVKALPLGSSMSSKGHSFETFGFSDANPDEGLAGTGQILGETTVAGVRVLQLRSQEVAQGMSGSPVVDVDSGIVVGVVTKVYHADATMRFRDLAFATPTEALIEVCPELARYLDVARPPCQPIARNLPPLPPHFVGRRDEITTLKAKLVEPRSLVAVVGMGGIGKTSLAIAGLQELEEEGRFQDGILWLDVRQYTSLDTLVMRLGELLCLDLSGRDLADQRQLVNRALKGRDVLVVADGLESVVEPAVVVDHLRGLPCTALITSRLQLSDFEVSFLVDSLPGNVGIELFAVLSDESLAQDHNIQALCEQDLGGHPLSIEIVAAMARAGMDPSELRQALREEPMEVLGAEQDPPEVQSVGRVLRLSFQSLTPPTLTVLTHASVFLADFDLDSLAAVLPNLSRTRLTKAIQELERRSLVYLTSLGNYRLHAVTRQYAYGHLNERTELHRRAAGHYAQLRTPSETWQTIGDLAPQLSEFYHCVQYGDCDCACQLLDSIDSDYLFSWGHYDRLVEMREEIVSRLTTPHLQMECLSRMGLAYHSLGQFEKAIERHEAALSIAQNTGDREEVGRQCGYLGKNYHFIGQIREATKLYEEALSIARETGDRRYEGIWLGYLGYAHRILGRLEQSVSELEEALVIARDSEIKDRAEEGRHLGNLGSSYRSLGHLERAAKCYREALDIVRELGYRRYEGIWLGSLGTVFRDLGQFRQAIVLCQAALEIVSEMGDQRHKSMWLGSLGLAYRGLGYMEQAREYIEEALVITRNIGERLEESAQLGRLGRICGSQGDWEQAVEYYGEALSIARTIGDRLGQSYHLLGLSLARVVKGELPQACQDSKSAYELDMPRTRYLAAKTLGTVCLHQKCPDAASFFSIAVARCQDVLAGGGNSYEPRYTLAIALVGQAVCDQRWEDDSAHLHLLAPALAEYRHALEITAAPGVVQDALRDIALVQSAGIEGLEPVFELLESANYEPDLPQDLPGILGEVA